MSEIIDYISEKASKVAEGAKNTFEEIKDYVQTGLESAKETIQENAKDIGKAAVRGTATVLTAAMLAGGLSGCGVIEDIGEAIENIIPGHQDPEKEIYFPIKEMRPIEEIQESGATVEDVEILYDEIALLLFKDSLKNNEEAQPYFDILSAQFTSMTVIASLIYTKNPDPTTLIDDPFYYCMIGKDGYSVRFNFQGAVGQHTNPEKTVVYLPKKFYEILASMGTTEFDSSEKSLESFQTTFGFDPSYILKKSEQKGFPAINPTEISRNELANYEQETLDLLLEMGLELKNTLTMEQESEFSNNQ